MKKLQLIDVKTGKTIEAYPSEKSTSVIEKKYGSHMMRQPMAFIKETATEYEKDCYLEGAHNINR